MVLSLPFYPQIYWEIQIRLVLTLKGCSKIGIIAIYTSATKVTRVALNQRHIFPGAFYSCMHSTVSNPIYSPTMLITLHIAETQYTTVTTMVYDTAAQRMERLLRDETWSKHQDV